MPLKSLIAALTALSLTLGTPAAALAAEAAVEGSPPTETLLEAALPTEPASTEGALAPISLGLTPVLAASAPQAAPLEEPLSASWAMLLSYGSPWAIWLGGSLLLAPLALSPVTTPIGAVLSVPIGLGGFFGISAGYFYVGEPTRGLLVGLGQLGILAGGVGANVLAFGPGQSAGFGLALTGPLILAAMLAYNVWAGFDLMRIVNEKNAASERERLRQEFRQQTP